MLPEGFSTYDFVQQHYNIECPEKLTLRLRYLDGLRGYAALTVLFGHAQMFYPGFAQYRVTLTPLWLRYLFNAILFPFEAGTFAVYIFFVLSGFVIAASASRGDTPLPIIVLNRYLRLTLPMLATALVAWLLLRSFPFATALPAQIANSDWIGSLYGAGPVKMSEVLDDVTWKTYWTGNSYIDPVLWTMKVELIGSLGVYSLYAAAKPSARLSILAVAGLACAHLAGNYLGFVIGAAFYEAHGRQLLRPNDRWWLLPLAAGLIGGAFGQFDPLWRWFVVLSKAGLVEEDPLSAAWSLSAALVVFALLVSRPFQTLMSTRPLRFLGRISFSLYLIHVPLLGTLLSWCYATMLPRHSTAEIMLWEAGFLTTSLLAASAMTVMIDEQVLSLLGNLKERARSSLEFGRQKQ